MEVWKRDVSIFCKVDEGGREREVIEAQEGREGIDTG